MKYIKKTIEVDGYFVTIYKSFHHGTFGGATFNINYTVNDGSNDKVKYLFTCYSDEFKADSMINYMVNHTNELCLEKSWDTWFDSLKFKEFDSMEKVNLIMKTVEIQNM